MQLNLNRMRCPDGPKTIGHQTCRKQTPGLWTKHEQFKFTSLIISPGAAARDWFLISTLLSVQFYSLQSMMCFTHALCIHGCLLQLKQGVPLQSRETCQLVCVLHWPESWIWWQNNSRLVGGIVKTVRRRPPELSFNQTKVPMRGGVEQLIFLDFNQLMTGDQWKFASLIVTCMFQNV